MCRVVAHVEQIEAVALADESHVFAMDTESLVVRSPDLAQYPTNPSPDHVPVLDSAFAAGDYKAQR